jgi:glycosyltransferase involved in cell wall biosynthesis
VHFLAPGSLTEATGGYHYDRRLVEGLRVLGWRVAVRSLGDGFPFPEHETLAEAAGILASIATDELVIIDGLALGAMPEVLASHGLRLRLIALVHHPLARETGLTRHVAAQLEESEQKALRLVRHVIVTSEFTRAALERYAVDPARVSVIEPGTDAAPLAEGSQAFAGPVRAAAEARAHQLLCVATITPRKGHAVLIEALAGLRHLPWQLVCVGSTQRSPQTAQALRHQIQSVALGDRVRIRGELDGSALEECFAAADLFVLPTHYEGYGMAVAEALAHGLPVVASRTGAIPELVLPKAGRVVEPGDPNSLRTALAEVLTDRDAYAALMEGARAARNRLPRWPEACLQAAKTLDAVKQQGLDGPRTPP